MKDIYDAIEKWLSEPENNSPEKRAKFLIRANRMVYDFVRSACSTPDDSERQGIANILEAVEDHRTDIFVGQRRQSAHAEKKT